MPRIAVRSVGLLVLNLMLTSVQCQVVLPGFSRFCGLFTGCGWLSGLRIGRPAEEIKRLKGIQGMPWHAQAMKDVARCDKRRGTASRF